MKSTKFSVSLIGKLLVRTEVIFMAKTKLLTILLSAILLAACSNDIVRERIIEIDEKYDVLCAQGPIVDTGTVGEELCTKDIDVIAEFKQILDGIDAKKFTLASDLVEFTKETDQFGSYMFGLFQEGKPNAATYHVTAYSNGIFQFPEIGTTEMRYVSKDAHLDKFKSIQSFMEKHFSAQ